MKPSRAIVFVGPSLPGDEAAALLPGAELRPPVRKGDVYAVLAEPIDALVVLDGVFHAEPSVWPRELLAAVDEGIAVYGASSMGALRAAECERFGMRGHGQVFEWYRDGVIDGDDEVALRHGDADSGWRALSEPLVNLRATLTAAASANVITTDEATSLIAEAKRTHYPLRTLRGVVAGEVAAGWTQARRDEVVAWLLAHRVDLKRLDARSLLERVAGERPIRGARRRPSVWEAPYRQAFAVFPDGRRGEELLAALRARPALLRTLQPLVRARWFAGDLARQRGDTPPADERDEPAWADAMLRRDGREAIVAAWARRAGLEAPPAWVLELGPAIAGRSFDDASAVLDELVATGRLGEL